MRLAEHQGKCHSLLIGAQRRCESFLLEGLQHCLQLFSDDTYFLPRFLVTVSYRHAPSSLEREVPEFFSFPIATPQVSFNNTPSIEELTSFN